MAFWNKEKHWRHRAEEVRMIAEGVVDKRARIVLLSIASEYDELAELAKSASVDKRFYYRERG